MTPSIRTFLLINLLLSVTLITSLAIIGNLFLAHRNIQEELDTQLIRTTAQLNYTLDPILHIHDSSSLIDRIQNTIDPDIHHLMNQPHPMFIRQDYHRNIAYQIWSKSHQLLIKSSNAPVKSFSSFHPGLSNLWLQHKSWRVFTLYDSKKRIYLILAEQSSYRQQLENTLTQDSIIIMLITYPFLGILIWLIVGKGLGTLKNVAQEVSQRAPSYLEPVDLSSIPTEIEPLVNELNSLFQRLRDAFEREKRFAADAAHELRTPLAALKTQAQVILHANPDNDSRKSLEKLIEGVDRATHVVQQLLTLSRMLPQESLQDALPTNLTTIATDIIASLAPSAIEKDIEVELQAPKKKAIILGNVTTLSILLRNLVDNAIRYSLPTSLVVVAIEITNTSVFLHVIDNGPGIAPELRQRVFERFFRVIGNKSRGSGLGLGIVRQIALLHNAKIDLLTPKNGKGLQITIRFARVRNK